MNGAFFRLFNIMNFCLFSRNHVRSILKANTMSKRIQERRRGEELEAKPRKLACQEVAGNRYVDNVFGELATEIASQCLNTRCEDQRIDLVTLCRQR